MRTQLMIGGALIASALLAGCKSPTQPTVEKTPAVEPMRRIAPMHDNITATFKGHEEGPTIWLCATELRAYIDQAGVTHWTEDHYLQYEPCPAEPIEQKEPGE